MASPYFKKFQKEEYTVDGKTAVAQRLLTAILPRHIGVDRTFIFQRYTIQSGERPEFLADKLYKDMHLWWVFMVINQLVDPYHDWKMEDSEVEDYAQRKYDGDVNAIHHYRRISTGKICDEVDEAAFRLLDPEDLPADVTPVTNLAYEKERNTARGEIIVISPRYISLFVDSYQKAIQGNP